MSLTATGVKALSQKEGRTVRLNRPGVFSGNPCSGSCDNALALVEIGDGSIGFPVGVTAPPDR